MADYILHFAKSGTSRQDGMPEQARDLLRAGLYGIPETAQLKARLTPGSTVVLAVGAPFRVFVGDAVVSQECHRLDDAEAASLPSGIHFEHGISLTQARAWLEDVPIMAVWPRTEAARNNPTALFYGTIYPLPAGDAPIIISAGTRAAVPRASLELAPSAAHEAGSRHSQPSASIVRAPESEQPLTVSPAPVPIGPKPATVAALPLVDRPVAAPREAIDRAPRAIRAAERSPDWLPAQIAHADWGTTADKRVVATAELEGGVYRVHSPRTVGDIGGLIERMGLTAEPGRSTLLGFDFPIGIPRAYALRAGIANFADWFRSLDLDSPFFSVAGDLADVSTARPFFPRQITVKTPGIKERYREALGLTAHDALRQTERAHCGRRTASEMFWTLGPSAVGKATLAGWRDTIRPALAESRTRYSIWPFDGSLSDLLGSSDAVIVETYPTEAYRQLDLRMGRPGTAKTSQEDRGADAERLLDWCSEHAVIPDEPLLAELLDGFGSNPNADDRFDAVVGLLGMIDTIWRRREPELPEDSAVRLVEGWMFGQHARCPEISAPSTDTPHRRTASQQRSKAALRDEERAQVLALLRRGLPSGHIARQLGIPTARVAAYKANLTMGAYAERPSANDPVVSTGMRDTTQPDTDADRARTAQPSSAGPRLPIDPRPAGEAPRPHVSDSAIQRDAEKVILERVSRLLGVTVAPRTLPLPGGARVEVDGASADASVLLEVFARQGPLKGGQQKKICQDALKLITLARNHPGARLLLVFADEQAAAYATAGTWVAEALAMWGIGVLVVDVGEELRAQINHAQQRQMMVNPSGSDDVLDA